MIHTFANAETQHFFVKGKSRRLPPEILKRAAMRMIQLYAAICIEDLCFPPSSRLEALDSGASALTTSGVFVFVLKMATLTMLKLPIILKEA